MSLISVSNHRGMESGHLSRPIMFTALSRLFRDDSSSGGHRVTTWFQSSLCLLPHGKLVPLSLCVPVCQWRRTVGPLPRDAAWAEEGQV